MYTKQISSIYSTNIAVKMGKNYEMIPGCLINVKTDSCEYLNCIVLGAQAGNHHRAYKVGLCSVITMK